MAINRDVSLVAAMGMLVVGTAGAGNTTFYGGTFTTFADAYGTSVGTNEVTNAYSRGGTSQVRWGVGGSPDPNILTFAGVENFVGAEDTAFVMGRVTYHNGVTQSPGTGGGKQGVTGILNAVIDSPADLGIQLFSFTYGFTLTPNSTGNPELDGDFLNFVYPTEPAYVQVGDLRYTLAIVGFRLDNGSVLQELQLPEGADIGADVMARFTTDVVPAPGVAPLIALAGLGLGSRRRR
jgi:uncharacterized protein (TIGR03382 family)